MAIREGRRTTSDPETRAVTKTRATLWSCRRLPSKCVDPSREDLSMCVREPGEL
jgi:hypothetical protein